MQDQFSYQFDDQRFGSVFLSVTHGSFVEKCMSFRNSAPIIN